MNFKPNENFQYYLNFMVERMEIFWKRYFHVPFPLTDDPIFREFKFTNVYRALDRVSQYLIGNVIYNGKEYSREDMFSVFCCLSILTRLRRGNAYKLN